MAASVENAETRLRTIVVCVVIHDDGNMMSAVIVETGLEMDGTPDIPMESSIAAEHQVVGGYRNPVFFAVEGTLVGADHVNVQVACAIAAR